MHLGFLETSWYLTLLEYVLLLVIDHSVSWQCSEALCYGFRFFFFFFLIVQTMKYESPVLLSILGDRVGSEMNERTASLRLAECRGKKGEESFLFHREILDRV